MPAGATEPARDLRGVVPQNESASGIPRVKLVLLGDSVGICTCIAGPVLSRQESSLCSRLAALNRRRRRGVASR